MTEVIKNRGTASLKLAGPLVAGAFSTIEYTYTAAEPILQNGGIKISFRRAGDFGSPQFDDPEADNYCSIKAGGNCKVIERWDDMGSAAPWSKTLFLRIQDGFLDRDETITVIFGDTSEGSRGWQLQTFIEDTFEFKTSVDRFATSDYLEINLSPTMPVIRGLPARAECLAPSNSKTDESFTFYVKLEDKWGNPAGPMDKIVHPGFPEAGNYTIEIRDEESGLQARSNPILITDKAPEYKFLWADLRGQTEEVDGTGSIEDYFYFGRFWARLDILAHQAPDYRISDKLWKEIKDITDMHNYKEPGKFVTFPGYQWAGSYPDGGARSIYFSSSNGKICRYDTSLLPDSDSRKADSPTAGDLFKAVKKQPAQPFIIANGGVNHADMAVSDKELEVGIEIHSSEGTDEWLLYDAFEHDCRVGVCANSGGDEGRPGASYPGASPARAHGGLTCVLSSSLTRNDVLKAIKSRHFYATTGNRCLIDMKLESYGNPAVMMGDELKLEEGSKPVLQLQVLGTAPLERIELRNGRKIISTQRPYTESNIGKRVKIVWGGAEKRGPGGLVDWSGKIAIEDNKIRSVIPINFKNPEKLPTFPNSRSIEWESCTNGGIAGMIIDFKYPDQGIMRIETAQGNIVFDLTEKAFKPFEYKYGGVDKQLSIYRLPDDLTETSMDLKISVSKLKKGVNPLYIKVVQEDGHMAWSSPIYIEIE